MYVLWWSWQELTGRRFPVWNGESCGKYWKPGQKYNQFWSLQMLVRGERDDMRFNHNDCWSPVPTPSWPLIKRPICAPSFQRGNHQLDLVHCTRYTLMQWCVTQTIAMGGKDLRYLHMWEYVCCYFFAKLTEIFQMSAGASCTITPLVDTTKGVK